MIQVIRKMWNNTRLFFPLVLLLYHLKHNLIGLFYWLFFFAIVCDGIGKGFGISYLFLAPEFQGEITFWSFLFIGFSFGGLTMAFHSYSYTRLAKFFPFLALVSKPFLKFSINNSIIPISFHLVYLVRMSIFQMEQEYATSSEITWFIIAYLVGNALFIGFSLLYFFPVNKNLFELKKATAQHAVGTNRWDRFSNGKRITIYRGSPQLRYWYIGKKGKIQQCRSTKHYQPALLQSVFNQNRISTSVFELVTIASFVLIGFIGGKSYFGIPAAVSIVLLLTIVLMLFSSLKSWLHVWTYPFLLLVIFVMDYSSSKLDVFHFRTEAYGMNYQTRALYNYAHLKQMYQDDQQMRLDSLHYIQRLTNWKKQTGETKPRLIIVNTSGGGSRSAAWVYEVLQKCDSMTTGKSTKHIAMITGASGGMVGAAFFRSAKMEDATLKNPVYFEQIASDLLNKLAFAASTNDLFFRYQSPLKTDYHATYDRALAFEQNLIENTNGILNHRFGFFKGAEDSGEIPVMLFTPTIVNDGRRLVFGTQGMSFLNRLNNRVNGLEQSFEMIDATQLLGAKQVSNTRFSSILRMNATFPYVLPMTTLPTYPAIYAMDAGTRDNFGGKLTVQWLLTFKEWIQKETSGVIILQIRDTKKVIAAEKVKSLTFLDRISEPFGNVLANFPRTQDLDQDEQWMVVNDALDFPFQMITFNLRTVPADRISLSWHLTSREKQKIKQAINKRATRYGMRQLKQVLKVR
jgi:hypothetical protein